MKQPSIENYLAFRQTMQRMGLGKPVTQRDIERAQATAVRRASGARTKSQHARVMCDARAAAMRHEAMLND